MKKRRFYRLRKTIFNIKVSNWFSLTLIFIEVNETNCCDAENNLLMFKRWKKIKEDFLKHDDDGQIHYDISKLPEICDNIKYDMIHYPELRNDPQREKLL